MNEKLKIGFVPTAANFFFRGNLIKKGTPDYREVENIINSMIKLIGRDHDVVSDGIITTTEEAKKLEERLMKENIDVMIISNIMWGEDTLLLNIVRKLKNIPIIIWCYSPFNEIKNGLNMNEFVRSTGPCGTYQFLPAIIRLERKFKFLIGKPEEQDFKKKLINFLNVNLAIKNLGKSRIGLIPSRWDIQSDTLVDESMLTDFIGPEVIHFSFNDLKKVFDRVSYKEIKKCFREIKEKYQIENVRDEVLEIAVRASLAFKDFSLINKINAISYNENNPDLHELIGLNPCIYLEELYKKVKVIGMEGDLPCTVMLLIFRHLTNEGIMMSEILTTDRINNFFLSGHPGNHNIEKLVNSNSEIKIVPDYEWKESELNIYNYEGAWMHFVAKEGEITLSQLIYHRGSLKIFYTRAKSIGKKIINYYPQASISVPMEIDKFLYKMAELGCGHHWTFAYGDYREELKDLSYLLNIKSIDIEDIS